MQGKSSGTKRETEWLLGIRWGEGARLYQPGRGKVVLASSQPTSESQRREVCLPMSVGASALRYPHAET